MNKLVRELADIELDRVCGGSEMAMINLQHMVSQRQMILQMTTSMMRAMNSSAGTVAKNIR